MGGVRGTDDAFLSWVVKVMQLASAHTDVEPLGHPALVGGLAGGAEVVKIILLILHSLDNPDLPGRVMAVVHWDRGGWAGLPVGADPTLTPHVGHLVGGKGLRQLEGVHESHSKH